MSLRIPRVILYCSLALCSNAGAQKAHTPKAGTEERQALMDALRDTVEEDLGRKVIFKVERLRVAGRWAYAKVTPTKPNGDEIDFSRTKYREQIEFGAFDPQGEALLRLHDDGWEVVEWVFGSTDVPSAGWAEEYGAPRSIFQ